MNLSFDASQGIDVNSINIFQFHHEISIGNHLIYIMKPVKDLRKSNEISVITCFTFPLLSHAFLLSSEIKIKTKLYKRSFVRFHNKSYVKV